MKTWLRQHSGRCGAIGLMMVVAGALVVPWARGADSAGPHGSVYTVDNESGKARTCYEQSLAMFQNLGRRESGLSSEARALTYHQHQPPTLDSCG